MALLLVKLTLAPSLVICSSLAGRRWGYEVAGLLVALPLVAGPILMIADLQRGSRFGARAASASLLGLVALASFVVVFAHVSRRRGWLLFRRRCGCPCGRAATHPPVGAYRHVCLDFDRADGRDHQR